MTHQQILDKLAAAQLVQAIEEDVSRLVGTVMMYEKHDKKVANAPASYLLEKLFLRWNCVLHATQKEIKLHYQLKTVLALAIVLHKYGFAQDSLTEEACRAIDQLNQAVVLGDAFERQTPAIKDFLRNKPTTLKRKPNLPANITFYRPNDVIAIELDKKYYCAYIHKYTRPNEIPIIEFYEQVFDQLPMMAQLEGAKAIGMVDKTGRQSVSMFAVAGLKFLPDLANQITLISACVKTLPDNRHLEKAKAVYTLIDLFKLQGTIAKLFEILK